MDKFVNSRIRRGKNIYSIYLMLKYINSNNLEVHEIPLKSLLWILDEKCWGKFYNPRYPYSPNDVLKHPRLKDFHEDIQRIKKANLSYPIILTKNEDIIDGTHRIAKAYKDGHEFIKAYIFTSRLMSKFKIEQYFFKNHRKHPKFHLDKLYKERFN